MRNDIISFLFSRAHFLRGWLPMCWKKATRPGRSVRRLSSKPQDGRDKDADVGRDLVTSYDSSRGMRYGRGDSMNCV